jgi:hypothetical protein
VLTLVDVLDFLIQRGPDRTEAELASAVFGKDGYQQQVNSDCRTLLRQGKVMRQGSGGLGDPYRYFPTQRKGDA